MRRLQVARLKNDFSATTILLGYGLSAKCKMLNARR